MNDQSNAPDATSSAADHPLFTVDDVPDDIGGFDFFKDTGGEIVDAELVDDDKPSRLTSDPAEQPTKVAAKPASGNAPRVDEWADFFSRVLIRGATDYYIERAFRDIDENLLTEREVDRIKLSQAERDRIAKPFAELANKLGFMRKHGRAIIASAGSVESAIQLGMWYSRVNRIRAAVERRTQPAAARLPYVMRVPEGRDENVSTGPGDAPPEANGQRARRPDIAGIVWNPDLG